MYNALVIGAGSIGALKPENLDNPNTASALTHAHAYYNNPETNLVAIIDSNPDNTEQAAERWKLKLPIYSIKDFYENNFNADIISVCTPTETHYDVMFDILKNCRDYPEIVISEKPFCSNLRDARAIAEAYEKKGIQIIVNYPRRFVPAIQGIKSDICAGTFGKIYSATFHYTRGLIHEGCHAIDLCLNLFGEFEGGRLLQPIYGFADRDEKDKTYAAYLSFEKCKHVFFSPCDGRAYKVFQLEIMTEIGKIIFAYHGMELQFYTIELDGIWGNKILSSNYGTLKTQLDHSLEFLIDSAIKGIVQSGAEQAIQVHEILEYLNKEK